MRENGKGTPEASQLRQVQAGCHSLLLGPASPGKHAPPRVNDEAGPKTSDAGGGMDPDLGRRHDKRLIFDGAGTKQRLPMSLAGKISEVGRDKDDLHTSCGQMAEEFREPEIVTNRKPAPDT